MDATAEPRKCRFTVQIDAAVDEQAFDAPSFRFRFLDGSKKQTSVIGASGWTSLAAVPDLEGSDQSQSSGLLQPPANAFRFEHVFSDVSIAEALANSIDDDPVLSFFFSDHLGLAGSAGIPSSSSSSQAKDAKGAAGNTKSAAPVPGSANQSTADGSAANPEQRAKAYTGIYDIDVSSLLAGKLQLEQIWTTGREADQSAGSSNSESSSFCSVFSPKKKAGSTTTANQSLLCMLLYSSESSSSTGLRYLAIRIILDHPLLSTTLAKKLNPLTIAISSARRLPGVTTTTATRSANLKSPHAPLLQHCGQFLSRQTQQRFSYWRTNPRLLITPGKPQDEHVEWNHSVTFLSSRFNRAELLDALQYATLTVETHDRDLTQADKVRKLAAKWEALHTTGVGITAVNSNASRSLASGDPGSSRTTSSTTTPRNGLSQQQQQQAPKPLEIFLVDDIAKRDCCLLLARSGEFFPHGVATFRLNELLNSAKQLVGEGKTIKENDRVNKPFISALKLSSDVVSVKRRATPLGAGVSEDDEDPFAVFDLTPVEKLVREPGAYLASGTALSIHVTLQHPIAKALRTSSNQQEVDSTTNSELASDPHSQCLFSRMVLIIPYKDTTTLDQVARVMAAVNLAALPGVPIRSYQMTEGHDSQFRTIFLEGLADKGVKLVHEQIPRKQQANDPQGYRMCSNDQIRFTLRLYTAFKVIDLKRIKLRYPLPILMNAPDIYMRSKVSENCFKALTRLSDVRHATRLEEAKDLDLFPSAQMLLEVESKYGESITLEDTHGHGSGSNLHHQAGKSSKALYSEVPAPIDAAPETLTGSADSSRPGTSGEHATNSSSKSSKRHAMTLNAPADSTNDRFEQLRKSRKDKDFLAERKKESDHVRSEYSEKKKLEEALQQQQSTLGPVYMYSGQKLRTQDALQDEMHKQLAKDHHATYTYSKEFQSLAVSLVDPDALRQTEELENRKKWTTQRGFVYPPPRKVEEYYKHKDVPSEARCEDLREPFVDNEYAGSVATQFATTLRETDASQFLATHPSTGKPKDFLFPSNTDLLTPQVKKHVSRKEIVPIASSEKQGLVWRND